MDKSSNGIGILNEHTLHLSLKNYIEPDTRFHEQKLLDYVVDILKNDEVIEIETISFTNVRKKLGTLLKNHKVTVVYPIAVIKNLVWIDDKTGELSEKRKSPKKGRCIDVCYELYKLKLFLNNPNFTLKLILAEITDYKRKNGWSNDGKRGSTREERVPDRFIGEIDLNRISGYEKLVDVIPTDSFTASDFAKANKISKRYAWYAISILCEVGVIQMIGKNGRAFLYKASNQLS